MDVLHAIVLGALQGLTEVLPISSSAHLILVPKILGWPASGLTFDVALHVGTLLALLFYFRNDVADLISNFFLVLKQRKAENSFQALPFYIIAGSIPAAIFGKTLENPIEDFFRSNPLAISGFLIVFGLVLAASDLFGRKKKELPDMNLTAALIVGVAQSLALLPGVSRSGITITAALFLGFSRPSAARFSFLLSLPIVAGAGILKISALIRDGVPSAEMLPLIAGVASSALVGYFSIAFLLSFVQRHTLKPFVIYRIIAGVLFMAWTLSF